MNALKTRSELINVIPQIIGLGTAELVAHLLKPLYSFDALDSRLKWKSIKPLKSRDGSRFIAIK